MVPSEPMAGPPPLVWVVNRHSWFEDWAPTIRVRPRRIGPFWSIDHCPPGRDAPVCEERVPRAVGWAEGSALPEEVDTNCTTTANRAMTTVRRLNGPPFSSKTSVPTLVQRVGIWNRELLPEGRGWRRLEQLDVLHLPAVRGLYHRDVEPDHLQL